MASHITMSKTRLLLQFQSLFCKKFLSMSTLNTQIGQNDIILKKNIYWIYILLNFHLVHIN